MILNSSLILSTISSYQRIHQVQLLQHDLELLPVLSTNSSYLRIHPVQLLQYSSLILSTISSYLRIHQIQLLQHDLELLPDPLHHLILPQDPSSPAPSA
jgi:hypothetical protein